MSARPIQELMQKRRVDFFLPYIEKKDEILEVGSGSRWFSEALAAAGKGQYRCIDLNPPADVVGDILRWRELGLAAESFDVIVAFELVEHVDCFNACAELLKPGGRMLITTPVPRFDWVMICLETLGLNQKRTSPHSNLVYLKKVSFPGRKTVWTVFGVSQWAIFQKD